jgi:DHA1 family bicyclomycin/chloramphenicol resistance-like MFS transporter
MTDRLKIPFGEFLALIGVMMAVGALSLDMILPALGILGAEFAVADANDRQEVITAFLIGIGVGQLFYGPLSDLFGRKRMLLAGLALFVAGAVWAAFAESFASLLAARLLQGFGAAAPRVISTAVVRDLFVGNRMARVMSFAMVIFIIVPIFAPALGMAVLALSSWHAIFLFMALFALVLAAWSALRLPETHVAGAGAIPGLGLLAQLRMDVSEVFRTPLTVGYTLALGFLFALLMTYVATAQQVFQDIYGLGDRFPLVFGSIAAVIAVANLLNARFVERFGSARIALTAIWGLVIATGILLLACLAGNPPLMLFWSLMAAILFLFAAIVPNLNSLAMVPMGRVAGTASSFLGFCTTLMAATIGWFIGQHLGETLLPLAIGFFASSLMAALIARYTWRRYGAARE